MRRCLCFFLLVLLLSPPLLFANDLCGLADAVTDKAVKAFEADRAEGLKLFLKASELCGEKADIAYNLGVAYYRYGRLVEARDALGKAVAKDGSNAAALNNLAQVLLELRQDETKALAYAEKAARSSSDPAVTDTLARARYANGNEVDALKGLHTALAKQSHQDLQASYDELLDRYLATQVEAAQSGKRQQALSTLARLDFEARAAYTRIQLLALAGQGEDALKAVASAQRQFPNDKALRNATDAVGNQVAGGLYQQFQSGQTAAAVSHAKKLAEAYPQISALKQAYDKLFEAMLADASTIAVPEAVARTRQPVGGGRTAQLLAGMAGGTAPDASEVDLTVDVDQNIPKGKKAGKYDVAVVIGNRTYGVGGVPNVDFAWRDARTMRQYLTTTMGFDPGMIIYEEDAGYAKFNEIFGNERDHRGKLHNFVKDGQSRVFVFYVGHGAPDLDSGDAYFVPVDANPQFLKTSGYRVQTFYDNLAKLPAQDVTVVLDACFSGNSASGLLFQGVSSITLRTRPQVAKPSAAVVFASAADDQVSTWYPEKRHSLFTYYFLKGLQGEADSSGDKKITVAEMEAYLNENVTWMAKKLKGTTQQPQVSGHRQQVLAVLK
ncbi:MAG: caspase family protein [Desulfuromonadaceae bacterium]|nr:caspase family protein [Desulfuromonadaceae bacterium]